MSAPNKKSFSLLSLLLLIVIVALAVSQVSMMRQLSEAEAELASVRELYGHIRVTDAEKTIVLRIQDNPQRQNAFCLHIPPGRHYVLHVTEGSFPEAKFVTDADPSATLSMNAWRDGADIVLTYSIRHEGEGRRIVVHTESEELFDYSLQNWEPSTFPNESWFPEMNVQKEFDRDEIIYLMGDRNEKTQRGVMLWMEPVDKWQERRAAIEAKKERAEPTP